jgi:hypothetical protein
MDILISTIIICTFFAGALLIISLHMRQMSRRRALPLREAYLQQNGSLRCTHCTSEAQREFGLDDKDDGKRIVACTACERDLYQFVRVPAVA